MVKIDPALKFKNICFVKTGWSERYQGDGVYGRHEHLRKFGGGYEAFNFKPGPDGRFYVYVPPHSKPEDPENWLVIIVAASTRNNGHSFGRLEPVGWLKDATFVSEQERPEYKVDDNFKLSSDNRHFTYSIVANEAVLIPVLQRAIPLPEEHGRKLGMSSMVIVREDGETKRQQKWREDYADYALALIDRFPLHNRQLDLGAADVTDPATLVQDPTARAYATAEQRRRVEKAAEDFSEKFFRREYDIKKVMSENRGYDFHMTRRDGGGEVLLEIKGTSGTEPAFYFTQNEKRCLDANPEIYRILLVTSALSKMREGRMIMPDELRASFKMEPLAWYVQPVNKPD